MNYYQTQLKLPEQLQDYILQLHFNDSNNTPALPYLF